MSDLTPEEKQRVIKIIFLMIAVPVILIIGLVALMAFGGVGGDQIPFMLIFGILVLGVSFVLVRRKMANLDR